MVDFSEPLQPPPPHQQDGSGKAVCSCVNEFGLMLLPGPCFETVVMNVAESVANLANALQNLVASIYASICNDVHGRPYQARRDMQDQSILARQLRSSPS